MDSRTARLGRPRALVCVAATLGSVLTAVVSAAGPASADPLSNARARAAALAQKISSEQTQVEVLSNQYDAAQYHLSQVQAQVATARKQLSAEAAATQRLRQQVTAEAVHEYTSGGFQPEPGSANVDPLVAQSYFQVATGTQTDALDKYKAAQRKLADEQAGLKKAEKDAAAAASALNGRRQAVMAAQSQAQSTLNGVNGQIATLVAQAQAAAAARLKAQQEAAFAAQQAAIARQRAAQLAAQQVAAQQAAARAAAVPQAAGGGSGLEAVPLVASPARQAPPPAQPVASPQPSYSPPPAPAPAPAAAPSTGSAQQTAVRVALAQVGKPYQWGAAGPGSFDCSGLVMYAYAAAGIGLPHYTVAQWDDTTKIPLAEAQPGDLIFFDNLQHVGIYLGNGNMVDAPHTGAFVRVESIFGFGTIDGATRVS